MVIMFRWYSVKTVVTTKRYFHKSIASCMVSNDDNKNGNNDNSYVNVDNDDIVVHTRILLDSLWSLLVTVSSPLFYSIYFKKAHKLNECSRLVQS